MKKIIFFILLFLMPLASAFGDVQVSLVSGKVISQKSGGSGNGQVVKPKVRIHSDQSLVLEKGAKIVLRLSDGRTVTLEKPGIYSVADLEKNGVGKKDLGEQVRLKAGKTHAKSSVTAVAGVRGADVDSQDGEKTNTNIKWKDK
jgi:hypothetical protein